MVAYTTFVNDAAAFTGVYAPSDIITLTVAGLPIPLTKFSLRISLNTDTGGMVHQSLNATVANADGRLDALTAAIGEALVLANTVAMQDGSTVFRSLAENLTLSSVSGREIDPLLFLTAGGVVSPRSWQGELVGLIYVRYSSGKRLVRVAGITEIRPGDTYTAQGIKSYAKTVTIYGSISGTYSEIS